VTSIRPRAPPLPPLEPIELANFLAAVVDQVRPLAASKAITITQSVPAYVSICGDINLLIRLFLNLFDNAIKYTPTESEIYQGSKYKILRPVTHSKALLCANGARKGD
jgi:signal transduction histidine kinase